MLPSKFGLNPLSMAPPSLALAFLYGGPPNASPKPPAMPLIAASPKFPASPLRPCEAREPAARFALSILLTVDFLATFPIIFLPTFFAARPANDPSSEAMVGIYEDCCCPTLSSTRSPPDPESESSIVPYPSTPISNPRSFKRSRSLRGPPRPRKSRALLGLDLIEETYSSEEEGGKSVAIPTDPPPPPTDPPSSSLRFTSPLVTDPNVGPSAIQKMAAKNIGHSLVDNTWLPPNPPWNGTDTIDELYTGPLTPCEEDIQKIMDYIAPNGNTFIGQQELYDSFRPFADPNAPTAEEFYKWNEEVWRHFRKLLKIVEPSTDPTNKQNLNLEARFANERKYTDIWDHVGGTVDSAYGPCNGGTNPHCGATPTPGLLKGLAAFVVLLVLVSREPSWVWI